MPAWGLIVIEGQMVKAKGIADAFVDSRLVGADILHGEPSICSQGIVLPAEHFANPFDGGRQVRRA